MIKVAEPEDLTFAEIEEAVGHLNETFGEVMNVEKFISSLGNDYYSLEIDVEFGGYALIGCSTVEQLAEVFKTKAASISRHSR